MDIEPICQIHNLPAYKVCSSLDRCDNRLLCTQCEADHFPLHRLEFKSTSELKKREVLQKLDSAVNFVNYKLTQARNGTENEIDQLFDRLTMLVASQLSTLRGKIKEKYFLNLKRVDDFLARAKLIKQSTENTLDRVFLESFSDNSRLAKLAEDIYEIEANILPNQEEVMENIIFNPNPEHLKLWQIQHEKFLNNSLWETLIDKKPPQNPIAVKIEPTQNYAPICATQTATMMTQMPTTIPSSQKDMMICEPPKESERESLKERTKASSVKESAIKENSTKESSTKESTTKESNTKGKGKKSREISKEKENYKDDDKGCLTPMTKDSATPTPVTKDSVTPKGKDSLKGKEFTPTQTAKKSKLLAPPAHDESASDNELLQHSKKKKKKVKVTADSGVETQDTKQKQKENEKENEKEKEIAPEKSSESPEDDTLPPVKFSKDSLPSEPIDPKNMENTGHSHVYWGGLCYIPTYDWIATAGKEGLIQIREGDSLEEVIELKSDMGFIFQLIYAESMDYLIASGFKKDIWICNIAKNFETYVISKAHDNTIYALEYIPSRNELASGGHDGQIKIWSLDGFVNKVVYKLPGGIPIGSIRYLAPFDKIVVGRFDGSMLVINQDRLESKIQAHYDNDFIHALYFDSKFNYLYSGSEDGTIKLWNCKTGTLQHVRTYDLNAKRKTSVKALVAITEKDLLFETRGTDMIRVWRISTGEVIKEIEGIIEKKKKSEPLIYIPGKNQLVTSWQKKICKIPLP